MSRLPFAQPSAGPAVWKAHRPLVSGVGCPQETQRLMVRPPIPSVVACLTSTPTASRPLHAVKKEAPGEWFQAAEA